MPACIDCEQPMPLDTFHCCCEPACTKHHSMKARRKYMSECMDCRAVIPFLAPHCCCIQHCPYKLQHTIAPIAHDEWKRYTKWLEAHDFDVISICDNCGWRGCLLMSSHCCCPTLCRGHHPHSFARTNVTLEAEWHHQPVGQSRGFTPKQPTPNRGIVVMSATKPKCTRPRQRKRR